MKTAQENIQDRIISLAKEWILGTNKTVSQIAYDLAIDEVRETGEPVDLKPMNSFERKIVHDVVREEGMKSRAHGEEPRRYVTVYLKASAAEDTEDEDEA